MEPALSRKLALVIGNSQYDDRSLAQLVTPSEDVNDLARLLKSGDIGEFDEVSTLVNESATNVRKAVARLFKEKSPDDLLLLYFSGHGVLDDQGQLYLAVRDTERDLLSGTAIPAGFITREMDRSRSRRQVLILDCCHSGAFARGAKGVVGATVGTASAFEGIGYGRVVLTATDATQYAWEGDQVIGQADNSVFTHFMIQGLQTGEADANGDGRITLDELYDYVYDQVVTRTPKQTPNKWSFKQQGDIVIAKNPRPVVKPIELPAELKAAIESPLANVREGAARELDRLLNGSNAGLALSAHEALRQLFEDDSRRVSAAAEGVLNAYAQKQARIEQARLDALHTAEAQRLAVDKAEADRLARERAEQAAAQRLAAEKAEADRLARERAEAQRLAAEKAEADRLARVKAAQERAEAERLAAQRLSTQQISSEQLVRPSLITGAAFAVLSAIGGPLVSSTGGPLEALPLGLVSLFAAATAFGYAARQIDLEITWGNIVTLALGWLGGVIVGGVATAIFVGALSDSCSFSSGSCNIVIGGALGVTVGLINGWVIGKVLRGSQPGLSIGTVALSWTLAGALATLYVGVIVSESQLTSATELSLHLGLAGGFSGVVGSWLTFRHVAHSRDTA